MYDPLIESYPKPWQSYPASYWAADIAAAVGSPLGRDINCDVVIIGAGYTGLSAAYQLASKYQVKAVVLEANEVGWGCSGRNAGFVLPGTGRLSLLDMQRLWGIDTANRIFDEYMASIDSVNRLITLGNIKCNKINGGYVKLAHTQNHAIDMQNQVSKLQKLYGDSVIYVSTQQVSQDLIDTKDVYGGIFFPKCFGLNPLKLVRGYADLAANAGAQIYSNSPVLEWQTTNQGHTLRTPTGNVTANRVIIASNGYTSKRLHPIVAKRHFPVLSSIIVTRPLKDKETARLGIKKGIMAMDTRSMKYYYRLLPDNRILFGGRGAIKGKDAEHQLHSQRLLKGLAQTFPSLGNIKAAYFWSGWISASYDNYPRIACNQDKSIHYAMGYCGSGLAFATQAGKRLAQQLMEPDSLPDLPFWQSPLKPFPFAPFRRMGLAAYYAWANLRA